MSAEALQEIFYTPEEYLKLERNASCKSEYINGQIYAMAGGALEHIVITANTARPLGNQLEAGDCLVLPNEMRVHIPVTTFYTYPDVTVVCGEPEWFDSEVDTLINPVLIIEVLSPSTASYDRGAKFAHYRRIASLQEYVMISQHVPFVEQYVRQETTWALTEVSGLDATLTFHSVPCAVALRDIYAKITFPDKRNSREP